LRTIIWKYDSNDWKVGTGNITTDTVNMMYESLVNMANDGAFDNVSDPVP
jgi:hypothetical protein